jgi:hypothetical protein
MRDRPELRSIPAPRTDAAVTTWRFNGNDSGPAPPEGEDISTPEFISIPEWAKRLGISAESGYKAARLGEIPGCFNIGRLYRINWPVFVEATSRMRSGSAI